jgi:hypothetical protein
LSAQQRASKPVAWRAGSLAAHLNGFKSSRQKAISMPLNLAQSPTRAGDSVLQAVFERFVVRERTVQDPTLQFDFFQLVPRIGAWLQFVQASRVRHLVADCRFYDLCRIDRTPIT